jgi:peptidoglycan/xylan/chitin deacetylase (PgdA/CDA1 family)
MQYLYDNDFHTLSLDELYAILFEGADIPPRSVMIQFDDGYYSNIVYALPVLRDFGFTAQLFLITHLVEDQGDYQAAMDHDGLTWTAAHSLIGIEDVFETASHTHSLHDYDTGAMLYNASREQIIEDTLRSFEFVNDHRAFAYPRGQYNDAVIEALQYVGIRMAFTVQEGYVRANSNPMLLNRFVIFRDTNMLRFHNIVYGRRAGIVSRVLSRIGEF